MNSENRMTREGNTHGRIALVTGGASGIGQACAMRLAVDGYTVAVADLNLDGAIDTAERIRAVGYSASAFALDVRSSDSCREVVSSIERTYGRLDALVCSAGIGQPSTPSWEQAEEDWNRVIDINLTGAWRSCTAAIPLMRKGTSGRIVLISSVAGKEGNAQLAAYSSSKAGLIGLTKSLGKELATEGILVNAITPALIETPMVASADADRQRVLLSMIPMRRMGQTEEVAALVSWLSSAECSFSTASVFDISGGRSTY